MSRLEDVRKLWQEIPPRARPWLILMLSLLTFWLGSQYPSWLSGLSVPTYIVGFVMLLAFIFYPRK